MVLGTLWHKYDLWGFYLSKSFIVEGNKRHSSLKNVKLESRSIRFRHEAARHC